MANESKKDTNAPGAGQGSGMPGDGKGRRDEVGKSGVYPASGPLPDDPNARYQGEASWGQGDRGAAGYQDSGTSEIHPINPLEEIVNKKTSQQSGAPGSGQTQSQGQRQSDPNREPGDEDLYNRDKQGNVFYDKNTEERRETQFHDATAADIGKQKKVTPEDDEFGKQGKQ